MTLALIPVILFNMLFLTGCWNYREVDNLLIVAGIAIDKDKATNKYMLTSEVVKMGTGKEGEIKSEKLESEGDSIFDAIRNTIKTSGQKLYWSHAHIVIISQDVAKEGITPVLDMLDRQPEPRLNLDILVSKAETAKEILTKKTVAGEITSFSIDKIIEASVATAKVPPSKLYKAIDDLSSEGVEMSFPTVSVIKNMDKELLDVSGTALFNKDKLVGFLSDVETKPFLYAKDELKGGLICFNVTTDVGDTVVTLEITESKSKIKPAYVNGKIVMNIEVNTKASIVEMDSSEDLLDDKGLETIKYFAQKNIEGDIQDVIKKVQKEYDTDVFGFGKLVMKSMPSKWREVKDDWNNYFKDLDVNVKSEVNILRSSDIKTPIKVGD